MAYCALLDCEAHLESSSLVQLEQKTGLVEVASEKELKFMYVCIYILPSSVFTQHSKQQILNHHLSMGCFIVLFFERNLQILSSSDISLHSVVIFLGRKLSSFCRQLQIKPRQIPKLIFHLHTHSSSPSATVLSQQIYRLGFWSLLQGHDRVVPA